jgi:hypothetical protein
MTKLTRLVVTIALTLSFAGLATAQSNDTEKGPHGDDHTTAAMKPQPSDAASTKAFKEVHMKMMRDMTGRTLATAMWISCAA